MTTTTTATVLQFPKRRHRGSTLAEIAAASTSQATPLDYLSKARLLVQLCEAWGVDLQTLAQIARWPSYGPRNGGPQVLILPLKPAPEPKPKPPRKPK